MGKEDNGNCYRVEYCRFGLDYGKNIEVLKVPTLAAALEVILGRNHEKFVDVKYRGVLVKEDSPLAKSRISRAERELTDLVVREHNKAIKLQTKLKRIREII